MQCSGAAAAPGECDLRSWAVNTSALQRPQTHTVLAVAKHVLPHLLRRGERGEEYKGGEVDYKSRNIQRWKQNGELDSPPAAELQIDPKCQ